MLSPGEANSACGHNLPMPRFPFVRSATVALAALAAGCAVDPPQVPEAPPPPVFVAEECDGQAAQFALGQPFNGPLGEDARKRARAERLRVVRPGDMITMEFDARRLTLELDTLAHVVAARCG
jgi:hypothetical protein